MWYNCNAAAAKAVPGAKVSCVYLCYVCVTTCIWQMHLQLIDLTMALLSQCIYNIVPSITHITDFIKLSWKPKGSLALTQHSSICLFALLLLVNTVRLTPTTADTSRCRLQAKQIASHLLACTGLTWAGRADTG